MIPAREVMRFKESLKVGTSADQGSEEFVTGPHGSEQRGRCEDPRSSHRRNKNWHGPPSALSKLIPPFLLALEGKGNADEDSERQRMRDEREEESKTIKRTRVVLTDCGQGKKNEEERNTIRRERGEGAEKAGGERETGGQLLAADGACRIESRRANESGRVKRLQRIRGRENRRRKKQEKKKKKHELSQQHGARRTVPLCARTLPQRTGAFGARRSSAANPPTSPTLLWRAQQQQFPAFAGMFESRCLVG
ncbi:hypothetical protein Q5P01_011263 [Channa striata]|uniref:Uncharacterized protein n=1 Tax=Channa striata TaxID=64152 RepID=A0AA88SVI1_CHASR|nr:hypothetical protein Q5P01_011263 [Channa striata]